MRKPTVSYERIADALDGMADGENTRQLEERVSGTVVYKLIHDFPLWACLMTQGRRKPVESD